MFVNKHLAVSRMFYKIYKINMFTIAHEYFSIPDVSITLPYFASRIVQELYTVISWLNAHLHRAQGDKNLCTNA